MRRGLLLSISLLQQNGYFPFIPCIFFLFHTWPTVPTMKKTTQVGYERYSHVGGFM
jgi:hypothetical protein